MTISRALVAALLASAPGQLAAAQPTAPRVRLVEDLRLDAATQDFSVVGRVSVGPRQQIVVPLPQDRQLRVFDAAGKPVASFGRRGSGPGEFEFMNVTGWVGDTLWVYDGSVRRTTFMGPDGKLLRSMALPQPMTGEASSGATPSALGFFTPLGIGGDGTMFGSGRMNETDANGRERASRTMMFRMSPVGAARLVHTPARHEDPRWYMEASGFGNFVPFRMSPQSAVSFDGTRFATMIADLTSPSGGTFTVTLMRTTGDTIFSRTYPFTGTPIPQASIDSALATFIPRPGQPTEGPSNLGQQFQAIAKQKMPAVFTPVQSLFLGLDNSVWITMRPTAEGRTTLVLNHRGDPIGSVVVPLRITVQQGSATHVWATDTDADGLRSVVRFRLSGMGCAPPECR